MKNILRIIVFYLVMWIFLIVLGGFQQESGLFPAEVSLAQLAPAVSAFLMLLIFRRDKHQLCFVTRNTPATRYLWAVLIPLALSFLVFVISSLLMDRALRLPKIENNLLPLFLWIPVGALGEEIGWRGYLNKRLASGKGGIISVIIVSLMWMPMHVHFFSLGPVFVLLFLLVIFSYSSFIYVLVQDCGFNIIVAAIFHTVVNFTNLLFIDKMYETSLMAVNAGVWVIAAVILILKKRKKFFL